MKYVIVTTPKTPTTEELELSTTMVHITALYIGYMRSKIKFVPTPNPYGYEIYGQIWNNLVEMEYFHISMHSFQYIFHFMSILAYT